MDKKELMEALKDRPVCYSIGKDKATEFFKEDKNAIITFISENLKDLPESDENTKS